MLLLKNGTVATMAEEGVLEHADVLAEEGKIKAVGPDLEKRIDLNGRECRGPQKYPHYADLRRHHPFDARRRNEPPLPAHRHPLSADGRRRARRMNPPSRWISVRRTGDFRFVSARFSRRRSFRSAVSFKKAGIRPDRSITNRKRILKIFNNM